MSPSEVEAREKLAQWLERQANSVEYILGSFEILKLDIFSLSINEHLRAAVFELRRQAHIARSGFSALPAEHAFYTVEAQRKSSTEERAHAARWLEQRCARLLRENMLNLDSARTEYDRALAFTEAATVASVIKGLQEAAKDLLEGKDP